MGTTSAVSVDSYSRRDRIAEALRYPKAAGVKSPHSLEILLRGPEGPLFHVTAEASEGSGESPVTAEASEGTGESPVATEASEGTGESPIAT